MRKFPVLITLILVLVVATSCNRPVDVNKALKYRHTAIKYALSDKPTMALTYFDSALYFNYKYADAYAGKSLVLLNIKDYKGAMANINKAIKYDSENGSWYYNKGYIYFELREYDKAIEFFDKCIKSNDVLAKQAYYYKGVIYLRQDDTVAARVSLKFALDLGYTEAAQLLKDLENYVNKRKK